MPILFLSVSLQKASDDSFQFLALRIAPLQIFQEVSLFRGIEFDPSRIDQTQLPHDFRKEFPVLMIQIPECPEFRFRHGFRTHQIKNQIRHAEEKILRRLQLTLHLLQHGLIQF